MEQDQPRQEKDNPMQSEIEEAINKLPPEQQKIPNLFQQSDQHEVLNIKWGDFEFNASSLFFNSQQLAELCLQVYNILKQDNGQSDKSYLK